MKIIHFMFTAVVAAVFASCDEHMDFPDTAMKIGDIVCTDGAIVRYEDVDSLHKTNSVLNNLFKYHVQPHQIGVT